MLASVYTDDEERGNAMGIALGGLAMGVLGKVHRGGDREPVRCWTAPVSPQVHVFPTFHGALEKWWDLPDLVSLSDLYFEGDLYRVLPTCHV